MFVIESGALVLGRVMESIDSIMSEVADLFRPLAEARAVRLRAVTEKKGLTAFVDRYRMVQAVSNVVANAVEISQDGGQVDLAVKQVGDHVEVAVSDTGPGIAPEEVEQIFDRQRWGRSGRRRASVGLGPRHLQGVRRGARRAHSRSEPAGKRFDLHHRHPHAAAGHPHG